MKTSKSKKTILRVIAPVMVTAMAFAPVFNTVSAFAVGRNGNIAMPTDYASLADAQAAAADLNVKLTGEGAVLLKNDGTLPLDKGAKVTVFGSAATSLQGGSGRVDTALADAGFTVNSTLVTENNYDSIEAEDIRLYNEAAIVVLKRGGGEGSDLSINTGEKADDASENVDGWEHKRLAQNRDGEDMKHYQMLTASEIAMIEKAKATCNKVVVLLNTSNAMEMYNLDRDNEINAIMFIGRPGANGLKAVPKLLNGELNPSGRLVAEWYKDFSADPTWYSSLANAQNDAGTNKYTLANGTQASTVGLYGVDYSEDIYLGYKYYETVYAEIAAGRLTYDGTELKKESGGTKEQADQWHTDNVVYPFGYGLSYTDFDMTITDISESSLTAAQISSAKDNPADVKTVDVTVAVKNTGYVAGKQVVEIYSAPPYTPGGIEKAAVNLVGYAKTNTIQPGKTQTVTITVNLQDIASYDATDANHNGFKGYELEDGTYTLYAASTSHVTDQTAKTTLEIEGNATLALDDFSDNEISNLFSQENGRYYSLRKNNGDFDGDGVADNAFEKEQVLLSREDLVGTFPVADPDNYVVSNEFAELMDYYAQFDLNLWVPEYAYFTAATAYKTNDLFGISGTKDVYKATKNSPAVAQLTMDGNYAVNDYIRNGETIYKVTKVFEEIVFTNNGDEGVANAVASRDYKAGEFIRYWSSSWGGINTNQVKAKVDIAKGTSFSTNSRNGNVQAVSASDRLVTSGENANVESINQSDFIALFAEKTETVNTGSYKYSDKLFNGINGENGYKADDELYDVTADMMTGWSQMADAKAQEAAMKDPTYNGGIGWIYFNELSGIKFNDASTLRYAKEFNNKAAYEVGEYVLFEGKMYKITAALEEKQDKEVNKLTASNSELAAATDKLTTVAKFNGKTGIQIWTMFMNQWAWNDFFTACWNGGSDGNAVANLGIPTGGAADSPTSWNSTYTWCCNCTIGSTWNVDLAEQEGVITATMGLLKNSTTAINSMRDQWMNPATNTHRTPFSGRNNEYYSQDGLHAGAIVAAVCNGAQSCGIGCHLKHMFLNDQETNRNSGDLFAWVSEQAIREIYIKSFQMGIQEGGAMGAMSAFARIGSVPTPVNNNMTYIIRNEWGSDGFFLHPDMYSPQANVASEDLMLRTGHNHAPGGNNTTNQGTPANNTYSGRWDANYENALTGTKGGVYIGRDDETTGQTKYYSNNQWYIVRYSAMIMYSEYANEAHSKNGLLLSDYVGNTQLTATQGTQVTGLSVGYAAANEATSYTNYTITSGALPAGLSLNATTGEITGTPTASGEFSFSVKGLFYRWIPVTNNYKITVASVFSVVDEDEEPVSSITVETGSELDYSITKTISGNATYSVTEGTLPEGVQLKGASLSGEPTKSGTYDVTITAKIGNTNYTIPLTIKVTGEDIVEPTPDAFKVEDGYIKAYDEATGEYVNVIAVSELKGADGKDGANGTNGKDGANGTNGKDGANGTNGKDGKDGKDGVTPTVEINADGYWVINGEVTTVKAVGVKGDQGVQGEKGDVGPQGPAGADGAGCGGVIGIGSAIAATATLLGAAVVLRKKED